MAMNSPKRKKEAAAARAARMAGGAGDAHADSLKDRIRDRLENIDFEEKSQEMAEGAKGWIWENVKLFFLLCLLSIGAGLIFMALFPDAIPAPSWRWEYEEEPLAKNAEFALKQYDALDYNVSYNGTSRIVEIKALPSPVCKGLFLADETSAIAAFGSAAEAHRNRPGEFAACVGRDGSERDAQGKAIGSNLSFSNMSMPYFQPWMLALKEGFVWHANASLVIAPTETGMKTMLEYRMLNLSEYSGRKAFLVRIKEIGAVGKYAPSAGAGNAEPDYMLVDYDSRMLLRAYGQNYEISLLNATFIGQNGGNVEQ
jgi:hypothetical protein